MPHSSHDIRLRLVPCVRGVDLAEDKRQVGECADEAQATEPPSNQRQRQEEEQNGGEQAQPHKPWQPPNLSWLDKPLVVSYSRSNEEVQP